MPDNNVDKVCTISADSFMIFPPSRTAYQILLQLLACQIEFCYWGNQLGKPDRVVIANMKDFILATENRTQPSSICYSCHVSCDSVQLWPISNSKHTGKGRVAIKQEKHAVDLHDQSNAGCDGNYCCTLRSPQSLTEKVSILLHVRALTDVKVAPVENFPNPDIA